MNRRSLLLALGGGALSAPGAAAFQAGRAAQARNAKLNFVFILIDDLGWKDTGCYGSTFYETPNIDRLASEGMRFTQAYAAAPLCTPTRASIMTGKYPARLHMTQVSGQHEVPALKNRRLLSADFRDELALEEITFAEMLKSAGYATGMVGKWHLGKEANYPEKQGFDVNIGGTHIGQPRSYFYPAWKGQPPIEGQDGDYLTDRVTGAAERFIEQNQSRPFFLYLAHYAVHTPIQAKQAIAAKYKSKVHPGQEQDNPVYAAMIESVDQSVGRILAQMEKLALADRTVVIFTSDNGGLLSTVGSKGARITSNAPLRAGKGFLYEGGIREPLIVRWPGVVKPGSTCEVPVSSIDYYPTFLHLAGIGDQSGHAVDGVSIVPLLRGDKPKDPRNLYWHFPHYSYQRSTPSSAIRQGDYKLIEFLGDGRLELFNLREDPAEKLNLAEQKPELAAKLHGVLTNWRKSVDARMPRPNPEFNPSLPADSID